MALGKLIILDGIEGSGKSTQIALLYKFLQQSKQPVIQVLDPGSTPVSERIRNILLDKNLDIDALTETLLYMAARAEMITRIIKPALMRGSIVISDRFISSTIAYQGAAGGINSSVIWNLGQVACDDIEPDLTIILDLPIEVSFSRIKREYDRIESKGKAYHEKVRQGFLTMANEQPGKFAVVNAARSPDEVFKDIKVEINKLK